MTFRLLKNDLRKKKAMNIILLIFMILASMFMASGINNVITVMNGTDYFFEKAGIGDYVIITSDNGSSVKKLLDENEAVKDYRTNSCISLPVSCFSKADGSKLEYKTPLSVTCLEQNETKYFDMNDKPLEKVEPGCCYISGKVLTSSELVPGDKVLLKNNGKTAEFTIAGKMKDALCGSEFVSLANFIVNEGDYEKMISEGMLSADDKYCMCFIDTDDVRKFAEVAASAENISLSMPASSLKLTYIMELILAFVTLAVSVCLIIVSFVVLKFSITFQITEDYREIGVMKAIGISSGKIRSLYLTKYVFIAILGSVIGLALSLPFGKLLLSSVTGNMVLGSNGGFMLNVIGSLLVVGITMLFTYSCTKKIKKATPLDAIRNGQTGERFKKKSGLKLRRSHGGSALYLAKNDIVSSPRRYAAIIITFCICTLLVLFMENIVSTINSNRLAAIVVSEADLYISEFDEDAGLANSMSFSNGSDVNIDERYRAFVEDSNEKLLENNMKASCSFELLYNYPITFNGSDYSFTCQQGVGIASTAYSYTEGTAPRYADEIAITDIVSEMTGAKIGDTITIHFEEGDSDCLVTAFFQTTTNVGQVIRLHPDAPTSNANIMGAMGMCIKFSDNPSAAEIEERKPEVKKLLHAKNVYNGAEFVKDYIGSVIDTLEYTEALLLVIAIIIVFLVSSLMERTFIADEKSQIALLKATGFSNGKIILWQVLRLTIVSIAAVLLAAVLSFPVTKLCASPIFGIMGASKIEYNYKPLNIFLLYPAVIVAVNMLSTFLQALHTRSIHSRDTANIE